MASDRAVPLLLALAGAGAGLLVAHLTGITSWLDAKPYLIGGVVCGVLLGSLIAKARK